MTLALTPSPYPWLERQRIDYGGGFGGADVTPPPDYGRLPPRPLTAQRSIADSNWHWTRSDGTNPDLHTHCETRDDKARRRAAEKEVKPCRASCES
jgi:hypothetical protein